jgi:hypothetical protein
MAYVPPNIVASGVSFTTLQADGLVGAIEALITKQFATSAPLTAATINTTAGGAYGGGLAVGTYYLNVTETNGIGETTAGPESAAFTTTAQSNPSVTATVSVGSATTGALAAGGYFTSYTFVDAANGGQTTQGVSQSAVFTVAAGNTPTITLPATPSFASGKDVYLTAANGASGSETLYASGITATTLVCTNALFANNTTVAASAPAPPSANTTSTNIPTVTFSTLQTGNSARMVYCTQAGGATGSETLYARNITAATYNLSVANPTTSYSYPLPTVNTTGLTWADANGVTNNKPLSMIQSVRSGNMQDSFRWGAKVLQQFLEGEPMALTAVYTKWQHFATFVGALQQICTDIGVLLDANPGGLHTKATGTGQQAPYRSWPT